MPGQQLSLETVETLLDDASSAGIETVRLYGGEPLLHPALPKMVRHAVDLGLSTYVTTNGLLLKQKIKPLYDAGLRNITIGFYGTASDYDLYVQRDHRFRLLEESIASVRQRYGSAVSMQLNYLLMRQSCTLEALHSAWDFAQRYDLEFTTDLIHYSLPYFTGWSKPRTAISRRGLSRYSGLDRRAGKAKICLSRNDKGVYFKHLFDLGLAALRPKQAGA